MNNMINGEVSDFVILRKKIRNISGEENNSIGPVLFHVADLSSVTLKGYSKDK